MFVLDTVIRLYRLTIDNRSVTKVDVDGTLLDVEPNCCCLGDVICAGLPSSTDVVLPVESL